MNCCNPKRLTFKSATGSVFSILAPCRHCYACEQKLRAEWTIRINYEMKNRFCVFVTFTYSDEMAHLLSKKDAGIYRTANAKYVPLSYNKLAGASLSPYTLVSKKDASDLLKQLQTTLKRLTGNKGYLFRYALNAEYGDNTHRAHMHLVLGFPYEMKLADCLEYCKIYLGFTHEYKSDSFEGSRDSVNLHPPLHPCKLWKFGHVVTQYAYTTKNIANYVSKHCVKFCEGTFLQNSVAPIFRKVSVHNGGLGVNQMCNDANVIAAYKNGMSLLSDGFKDGKPVKFQVGVPMAVRRRLHPQCYTDNELEFKVTKLNMYEADCVAKHCAEKGILTSEHLLHPVESLSELRPYYYNDLTLEDNENREKTNEHRLIEKRKNGGYVH